MKMSQVLIDELHSQESQPQRDLGGKNYDCDDPKREFQVQVE